MTAGRSREVCLTIAILAAPAWLMADRLRAPALILDDFAYVAESRSPGALKRNLFRPHNAHVVPLFRLGTFAVAGLAGSLENLPGALVLATMGMLGLVMIAAGRLVRGETGSPAAGLIAMAWLGGSTALELSSTWFSAGQTLWAALAILGTLLAVRSWRDRGGRLRMVAACLAALAAPSLWAGGFVAVPAAWAFLGASRREGRSRPTIMASALFLTLILSVCVWLTPHFRRSTANETSGTRKTRLYVLPIRGLSHTSRAIPECLILNNLGLDAATTVGQGLVLSSVLGFAWLFSRKAVPNSLEASGATIVVLAYGMAFTFRGELGFESLRDLQWYNTLPHVGAVLFAIGWWDGLRRLPRSIVPGISARDSLAVVAFVACLLAVQVPRAARLRVADRGSGPPVTEEARIAAIGRVSADSARQKEALAGLDRVEAVARRQGIGRKAIRAAFGRVVVPGWPREVAELDALDLLRIPEGEGDGGGPPERVRDALSDVLPASLRP